MSCHSTSGGLVSTSLARAVTGLTEKEIQHIFHALKREAGGMASPSELQINEWRARQYDLLTRMKRMSDTRRDKLRDRIWRTRGEPVPDGATFHAWSSIEARARQEVALREVATAVDLDPPGSHAHQYTLGEDGRPTRVWYASYGSNLHRDRFMHYIQGGKPEGSSRTYTGCTDKTEPAGDIPIRFAGARPHFALTSRVWHGGIAFIDAAKGESAQGLGRAYDINISQYDEIVAQENGLPTSLASPVPLDEVLSTGRSVIGDGTYETMLHIGDYQGAPVITFTAPFSTREALTKTGHILRTPTGTKTPVRMPVMTNKPSVAYLRMIGSGLAETFGMTEVQQADYLRGCPGGDRWSRQQMVRILRGEEPDPARQPGPENPRTVTATNTKSRSNGKPSKQATSHTSTKDGGQDALPLFSHTNSDNSVEDLKAWAAQNGYVLSDGGRGALVLGNGPTGDKSGNKSGSNGTGGGKAGNRSNGKTSSHSGATSNRRPTNAPRSTPPTNRIDQRRRDQAAGIRDLPKVRTYPSVEEQEVGLRIWQRTASEAADLVSRKQEVVNNLTAALNKAKSNNFADSATVIGLERTLTTAEVELHRVKAYSDEAHAKFTQAHTQRPARYYRADKARTRADWEAEDARIIDQQRHVETVHETAQRALADLRHSDAPEKAISFQAARVARLERTLDQYNQRAQEIWDIMHKITANERPASKPPTAENPGSATPAPGKPRSGKPKPPTGTQARNRQRGQAASTGRKR